MAKRRLQCRLRHRLQEGPRNTGPAATARPVPFTITQFCMYWTVVKCVQANACPWWAANYPCTNGCPLENCRNWGPIRATTAPSLKTNVIPNIEKAQEASPALFQAIFLVVFHPDVTEFSPSVLARGAEWPVLLVRADTVHADQALTETFETNPPTPEAGGSGKIN